jgi:hypothetical protein
MVNDYERRDFWKIKIKITGCNNEKAWYHDKIGQIFEVHSSSIRDRYVLDKDVIKPILNIDSEIIN